MTSPSQVGEYVEALLRAAGGTYPTVEDKALLRDLAKALQHSTICRCTYFKDQPVRVIELPPTDTGAEHE